MLFRSVKLSKVKLSKRESLKYPSLLEELYKEFPNISERAINNKCDELYDYCLSKGKKYKDYLAFARNAIRKDKAKLEKRTIVKEVPEYEDITDEQRKKNLKKLANMKKEIFKGR